MILQLKDGFASRKIYNYIGLGKAKMMSINEQKHSFRLVLEDNQHEALRQLAFRKRTNKTALIREAIDRLIEEKKLEDLCFY